jgi:hypothetical protein
MKKICSVAMVAAATVGLAGTPAEASVYPPAGKYATVGKSVVHDDPNFRVNWWTDRVLPYGKGQKPKKFQVNVTYINKTDQVLYFSCQGFHSKGIKIRVKRRGHLVATVRASNALCAQDPGWNIALAPHRGFRSWAVFPFVPRKGDRVSVEWSTIGHSAFLNPYGRRLR